MPLNSLSSMRVDRFYRGKGQDKGLVYKWQWQEYSEDNQYIFTHKSFQIFPLGEINGSTEWGLAIFI